MAGGRGELVPLVRRERSLFAVGSEGVWWRRRCPRALRMGGPRAGGSPSWGSLRWAQSPSPLRCLATRSPGPWAPLAAPSGTS